MKGSYAYRQNVWYESREILYRFSSYTLFFHKDETEYGLGAIPLGGFVKISGMIDESLGQGTNDCRTSTLGVQI